jgi:hypothetical protein
VRHCHRQLDHRACRVVALLFLGRAIDGAPGQQLRGRAGGVCPISPNQRSGRSLGQLGAAFAWGFVADRSSAACAARFDEGSGSSSPLRSPAPTRSWRVRLPETRRHRRIRRHPTAKAGVGSRYTGVHGTGAAPWPGSPCLRLGMLASAGSSRRSRWLLDRRLT